MVMRSLAMPIALLAGCGCMSLAQAAVQQLDGAGFTVTYDDAELGLFGAPTLTLDGKTILFSPINLLVKSVGTQGAVTLSDSLSFDITPDAGVRVASVTLGVNGDYRLVHRSSAQQPSATVFGQFSLTDLSAAQSIDQSLQLDPGLPIDIQCNSLSCPAQPWAAGASLLAPEIWGSVPVRTMLTDTIGVASFGVGDSAFLEKKATTQTISILTQAIPQQGTGEGVAPVPLPAGLPLLLSGLLSFFGISRLRTPS